MLGAVSSVFSWSLWWFSEFFSWIVVEFLNSSWMSWWSFWILLECLGRDSEFFWNELLADKILLASHFPHKQAPAVRIFLYFEIEWNKLCEKKTILGKLSKVWPSGLVLAWEVALRLMCPASRRHSFSSSSAFFLFLSSPSFLSSSLINSLGGFLKGPESYLLHASLAKTIFGYSFFLLHAHHVKWKL